jgi:hypothetical protein
MRKRNVFFADLTHTAQGISAATFPLGISFVVSYATKEFASDFDFRLFKFPSALDAALCESPPAMLCLSNYSWNLELAYTLARLAKARQPGLIVALGGPNFPVAGAEKAEFLARRPAVDFYLELEGELGFADLVRRLDRYGFDARRLREHGEVVTNCSYLADGRLVAGPGRRIDDVNVVPSPYLTGILDEFFGLPLVPMIETTRGCPFSCTFCADGIEIKSKVHRFDPARTREELAYIADHVRHSDEIIITDLNFGMYKEDVETGRAIAEVQGRRGWPVLVKASAGKNRPERVIETAGLLNGSWLIGAAIQSYDPDVLKAIKRSNISRDAFQRFIEYGNSLSNEAMTYTEVILGLPGDTRDKHFASLRFSVANDVNSLRMYQAMLLAGTEMATPECRRTYGLLTKFRTIPGCVGMYPLFGEDHPVAEIEEIIVGSTSMPFAGYLDCRIMNLIVETFYNNSLFEEVFAMVRAIGGDVFDALLHLKEHPDLYPPAVRRILAEFVHETSSDLFDTREEAERFVLTPEVIGRYIGGELGINELLVHKAKLFQELPAISRLLVEGVKASLRERDLLAPAVERYLDELLRFIVHAKRDITDTERVTADEFTYDFVAIGERRWRVDPRELPAGERRRYVFFHDEDQKRHIARQMTLYSSTPIGFGRFIQRSNLKRMYRRFAQESAHSIGVTP